MNYLRYILCAALLLTGCQKVMIEPTTEDTDQLVINPTIEGMPITQTRAAGTDTKLETYGFYLAGYHTMGLMADNSADAYPNVFDKEVNDKQVAVPLVIYENGKFTLKTIKWQLDAQSYLSFFGWSQSKAIPTTGITSTTTGIIGHTKSIADKGYPWIDIRNADAPVDQTDVVGASSIDHRNDAVLSAVDLDYHHLLSKISFSAKSSSGAKVTISSAKIKYATNKVYKKARYTFGSQVNPIGAYGSYAEYHAGAWALNSSTVTVNGNTAIALGSGALLIPQALAAGAVSLELTYSVSPNGTLTGTSKTKTLPLSALTLASGNNYLYTIDVQATQIVLSVNPQIEPWNNSGTSLPLVPGPRGNTLLLLDGYEKPYQHTDGKWYWLDRSGYNRHVELTAGYVSYDAAKYGYVFNSSSQGGKIPDFGSLSAISVDVITEGTGTTESQQPYLLGLRAFNGRPSLGLPNFDLDVEWTYPGDYSVTWTAPSREVINRLTMWSTTWGNGRARLYQNVALRAEQATSEKTDQIDLNYLSPSYDGRISYLKVTNAERPQADIVADGEQLANRFGTPKHKPNPPTADQILTINGVKWAKGNLVGIDGINCEVGNPEDNGLYFKSCSLVGLNGGATGYGRGTSTNGSAFAIYCNPFGYSIIIGTWADVGVQANPITSDNVQTGMGDPCRYYLGSPWRVPTLTDFQSLTKYSPWTSYLGMNGNYGGSISAGWNTTNSLFFPAAGMRELNTGVMEKVGDQGAYVSSTKNINQGSTNHGLWIRTNATASMDVWNFSRAYPVRCVSN